MGYQPVPNTVSAELVFWNGNSYAENVLHFTRTSAWNQVDMLDLAAALRTWWSTSVKPIVPATIFLNKIIVKDLSDQFAPGIEYTAGMPLPGSSESALMPMSVTVAVKLNTGLRGRSFRGRIYHIGLREDVVQGDKIIDSFMPTLIDAYQALLGESITSLDAFLCVVSRWQNLLPRATGVATVVTNIGIEQTIDSQRRRLLGRGK